MCVADGTDGSDGIIEGIDGSDGIIEGIDGSDDVTDDGTDVGVCIGDEVRMILPCTVKLVVL